MGILKRAADLGYTFRFIRLMVMDWKDWDAYKLGLIDENGKRNKNVKMDTDEKKSAYTPFIRLAANIKRLVAKIPGGGSRLGSFASALYLIKEKVGAQGLEKICEKLNVDVLDFLNEKNEWFLLDNKQLSPGVYRVSSAKLINGSCDELVWPKDQIRIKDDSFPKNGVPEIPFYDKGKNEAKKNLDAAGGNLGSFTGL